MTSLYYDIRINGKVNRKDKDLKRNRKREMLNLHESSDFKKF